MNRHYRLALRLSGLTALSVAVSGITLGYATGTGPFHGIYCATGYATTAGCDITLHGHGQYLLGWLCMVLVIPLAASVLAFVTTALTADHIDTRHRDSAAARKIAADLFEHITGSQHDLGKPGGTV